MIGHHIADVVFGAFLQALLVVISVLGELWEDA